MATTEIFSLRDRSGRLITFKDAEVREQIATLTSMTQEAVTEAQSALDRAIEAVNTATAAVEYMQGAITTAQEAADTAVAAAATFETDTTLAVSGKAADASATGTAITTAQAAVQANLDDEISEIRRALATTLHFST